MTVQKDGHERCDQVGLFLKRPGGKYSNKMSPKFMTTWGAAIAQWIHLRLPSCHPGFSPKYTINAFINLYLICVM